MLLKVGSFWFVAVAFVATTAAAGESSGWHSLGPFGGPAGYISVDRQNPQRLIASSKNGNIFISEDAGQKWRRLAFPRLPGASIEAVKIHPTRPDLFFAAVADETREHSGLYVSCDAGHFWYRASDVGEDGVFALTFFDKDPAVMAVGSRRGVSLSRDFGVTWKLLLEPGSVGPTPVMSLAFDPTTPETIFAGTTHLPWKTTDGGKTWRSIHTGMIDDSDVFSIHVNRNDASRVFASACSGIYASNSGGETWRRAQGIPGTDRRTHVVTEDPQISTSIYAGTTAGLYRSLDSGLLWKKLNDYAVRSVEFSPQDSKIMYLATQDRGLLKSTTAGADFAEINSGYVGRPLVRLLFPSPSTIVAVAMRTSGSAGLYRTTDGGQNWNFEDTGLSSVGDAAYFQQSLYVRAGGSLYRQSEKLCVKTPVVIPPIKPARTKKASRPVPLPKPETILAVESGAELWVGTQNGLFRSADGRQWTAAPLPVPQPVTQIHLSGTAVFVKSAGGWLLSTDRATTWTSIPDPPGGPIYQLAGDVESAGRVIATTSAGLMEFHGKTGAWQKVEGGLPPGFIYGVVQDRHRPAHWYASQMGRVFHSGDGSRTWKELPEATIESALIQKLYLPAEPDGRLYALTERQGVFARKILP